MSRELWAVEPCTNPKCRDGLLGEHIWEADDNYGGRVEMRQFEHCTTCDGSGTIQRLIDFDAVWRRYYETADRRFKEGLTYNELFEIVYGEKKEEE